MTLLILTVDSGGHLSAEDRKKTLIDFTCWELREYRNGQSIFLKQIRHYDSGEKYPSHHFYWYYCDLGKLTRRSIYGREAS